MTPKPNGQVQYVQPDGRLTLPGMELLLAMAREIEALKAQVADHEARITALEP